ncbi:hypothetical protein [uncultured Sunxiuqinia sp.]|uniref:hypothetical protein n=1 Tax=uncultured Sunxiuqinia sp. TaxID=1573825 RepID=UPI002AA93260|nr:hypothetical protein [uncultured Sunxiuqinia sp.]
MNKNPQLKSEGELFLEHFFKKEKIKATQQEPIRNLNNDSKSYRIADFDLPQYKIYVEFQGLWNNTKVDRERYKEKMKVYHSNGVKCLYLYPENLGIIDYVFHARMLETLKKFRMYPQLRYYKLRRLFHQKQNNIIWVAITLYFLIMTDETSLENPTNMTIYGFIGILFVVQLTKAILGFISIYKNEK